MFKKTVLVFVVVLSSQCTHAAQQSAQAPSSPVAARRLVCPNAPVRAGKASRTEYSYSTMSSIVARLRFVKRVAESNLAYHLALNSVGSQNPAAQ